MNNIGVILILFIFLGCDHPESEEYERNRQVDVIESKIENSDIVISASPRLKCYLDSRRLFHQQIIRSFFN
jgi:hypothetical protein